MRLTTISLDALRRIMRDERWIADVRACAIEMTGDSIVVDMDGAGWTAAERAWHARERENRPATIQSFKSTRSPNTWGPRLWAELHARPFDLAWTPGTRDDEWLIAFSRRLPCGECVTEWTRLVKANPYQAWPSREAYSRWTVDRHNDVNRRLGKAVHPT